MLTYCVLLCSNYNSELVAFPARLGEKFDDSKLHENKVPKPQNHQSNNKQTKTILLQKNI